jgi:Ca2+-binding EF-hand superfamily protein
LNIARTRPNAKARFQAYFSQVCAKTLRHLAQFLSDTHRPNILRFFRTAPGGNVQVELAKVPARELRRPMKITNAFQAGAFALMLAGLAAFPASARTSTDLPARVLKAVDTDHDGAINLAEAKQAAAARFDRLDTDHDGTLTFQEFQGSSNPRPSRQEFDIMDKDRDGTVSKEEYLAEVERLFTKIDADKDGTIDAKELGTPTGRILAALLL